jgi:hypothetical protein
MADCAKPAEDAPSSISPAMADVRETGCIDPTPGGSVAMQA